jgi:hypothetical protein
MSSTCGTGHPTRPTRGGLHPPRAPPAHDLRRSGYIRRSRVSEVIEMTGWHALILTCAVSGALGFSSVRLGIALTRGPAEEPRRDARPAVATMPAVATLSPPALPRPRATASAGPTRARHSRGASSRGASSRSIPPGLRASRPQQPPAYPAPRRRPSAPAPSGSQPEGRQLALWASQVAAGTRKMSLATDGCRVTWNRSCKHGHPSWLVYLGYLSPAEGSPSS